MLQYYWTVALRVQCIQLKIGFIWLGEVDFDTPPGRADLFLTIFSPPYNEIDYFLSFFIKIQACLRCEWTLECQGFLKTSQQRPGGLTRLTVLTLFLPPDLRKKTDLITCTATQPDLQGRFGIDRQGVSWTVLLHRSWAPSWWFSSHIKFFNTEIVDPHYHLCSSCWRVWHHWSWQQRAILPVFQTCIRATR
jgi:hypothetical protein